MTRVWSSEQTVNLQSIWGATADQAWTDFYVDYIEIYRKKQKDEIVLSSNNKGKAATGDALSLERHSAKQDSNLFLLESYDSFHNISAFTLTSRL